MGGKDIAWVRTVLEADMDEVKLCTLKEYERHMECTRPSLIRPGEYEFPIYKVSFDVASDPDCKPYFWVNTCELVACIGTYVTDGSRIYVRYTNNSWVELHHESFPAIMEHLKRVISAWTQDV